MNPSETNYLDALLKNDEKLIKQLYLETFPSISSYIQQNSGTEQDARDIFQEALLAVFQKARGGQLQIKSGFLPYLYAVCKNLWLMQLRKKARNRVSSVDESQLIISNDSFGDAEQTANQYARQQLLSNQLNHLGEGCRKLLRLAWSGKPLEEVARQLNNSYAYIRKKKSECMAKLVALIKKTSEYQQLKW
jgi:RNA polymerase sigma factor (sigma-70 family)